jgi:hypothetical protein
VWVVSRGGVLMNFNAGGGLVWQQCILDAACSAGAGTYGGVAIADVNNDGVLDAVAQGEQKLWVMRADNGAIETYARTAHYAPNMLASWATPTIATGAGGKTWIVTLNIGDRVANLQTDGGDDLVVSVWTTNTALGAAPWPTFKGNMERTGGPLPVVPNPVATQNFVKKLYVDFLGRTAGPNEVDYWATRLMNHEITRFGAAGAVALSPEWITNVITRFYLNTLHRQPEAAGLSGWIVGAQQGMPIAEIAAAFYASQEYFQIVGRSDFRTWVTDLYAKLLFRQPDAGGFADWVTALEGGLSRNTVAFRFYQSQETINVRIADLYQRLLARTPEPAGVANWSPFVAQQGDLVLAAAIAGSQEYFNRAQL